MLIADYAYSRLCLKTLNTIMRLRAYMPRVSADISKELNQKLKEYIVKTKGTLRGSQGEVIAEAIKEFLERHAND